MAYDNPLDASLDTAHLTMSVAAGRIAAHAVYSALVHLKKVNIGYAKTWDLIVAVSDNTFHSNKTAKREFDRHLAHLLTDLPTFPVPEPDRVLNNYSAMLGKIIDERRHESLKSKLLIASAKRPAED